MQMFKIDKPENCACGVAIKNQASNVQVNVPGLATGQSFEYQNAEVQSVEFIVWDLQNGVKLRSLDKFQLNPNINAKDYVASLLTDAASAVDMLAGFYGKVNDFNPADWIVNATREVTFICFTTVTTYIETSGNVYACNENALEGERLGVPSCDAEGLLDVNFPSPGAPWPSHPFRVFQPINAPQFTYDLAAGTTSDTVDGPGGSHTVEWFESTMTGPGECSTSADCMPNTYHCNFDDNTCQMCITDAHCLALAASEDLVNPTCVSNNGHRACMFEIVLGNQPTDGPGTERVDALDNSCGECPGGFCSEGTCISCREPNDCELKFSPGSRYAKICNETTDEATQELLNKQCNFYFLPPQETQKKDMTTIIGLSAAVAGLVLIIAIIGVVFAVKKYRSSEAFLEKKRMEDAAASSTLTGSPLYDDPLNKKSNPMYVAQK